MSIRFRAAKHFGYFLCLGLIAFASSCGTQTGDTGPQGPPGDPGAPGATGPDGSVRVFGNGSAGARTTSADESWLDAGNPPANIQFTDFTVNAGVTLTVPSGTVIRCTGTFTNNGTISVMTGATGAVRLSIDATTIEDNLIPANPGVAVRGAGSGEVGDNSATVRLGGAGSPGLEQLQARELVMPGTWGGGGGGSTISLGGSGGGSFVVLCQGDVVNTGAINANGAGGGMIISGGGGAGGFIVLASTTSVTNSGSINANGGPGSGGGTFYLASGGGGGGIIHMIAPTLTLGTTSVKGGAEGNTGANLTAIPRSAGAGGGGCGGPGGTGDSSMADGTTPNGVQQAGGDGYVLYSLVDPTSLFL